MDPRKEKRNWIDAHCHLADPRLGAGIDNTLKDSVACGVSEWIQGGVDPGDWQRQIALKARHSKIHVAFGLHPWVVARMTSDSIKPILVDLERHLNHKRPVGLGELGLDMSPRFRDSFFLQNQVFGIQLEMARNARLPVILHIVRAHREAQAILSQPLACGGIVHSFSGNLPDARAYIDRGLVLSFSGSKTIPTWLKSLPTDSWVVETDAPDQLPPFISGAALNCPANLIPIATRLAESVGLTVQSLLDRSAITLRRIFSI